MHCLLLIIVVAAAVTAMPFDTKNADTTATYSDDFARNKILPICAATDNADPLKCLRNFFVQPEVRRRYEIPCSKFRVDKCVGFAAVDHGDKVIILAFKGTAGNAQLLLESEETVFSNRTAWISGGVVSKYFSDGFFTLWNGGMKDDFVALKNQYPTYQLWVAGHSLGGAMASLAASYISHTGLYPQANMRLVTFGQPRTGDKDFAAAHERDVSYAFRIIHAHDVVPHLPPNGVEQYRHHLTEIYYNNDMTGPNYVVCEKEETLGCSDGKLDTSTSDHSYYFNIFVSEWGAEGCQPN